MQRRTSRATNLGALALLLALVGACSDSADPPFVRLADLEPGLHEKTIGDSRRRILDPTRPENVFPVESLPATSGDLQLALGVGPTAHDGRVRFEVLLGQGNGASRALLREEIDETGWHERTVRLRGAAPGSSLVFRRTLLEGAPEALDDTAWGSPLLLTGAKTQRPSVILVSVDTLRADRVGAYGHDRAHTPTLDRLAREGVLYEHTYAPSTWTLPSHASMLFGLQPFVFPLKSIEEPIPEWSGSPVRSLAAGLRAAGYLTAGITGGGFVSEIYGFAHGFDRYDSVSPGTGSEEGCSPERFDGPTVFERARSWLRARGGTPFFLFVHTYDAHDRCPLRIANRPFAGMPQDPEPHFRIAALYYYDSLVTRVDELVGDLVAELEALGLAERVLLIVTSDHGEAFWEHGEIGHGPPNTPYEGLAHVPLIVRWPGHLPAGVRVEAPVAVVRLAPTIRAWLGLPPEAWMHAVALPIPGASEEGPSRPTVLQNDTWLATWDGRYKLFEPFEGGTEQAQLYDLEADPGETVNRVDALPGVRDALQAQLDAYRALERSWQPTARRPLELDEATKQQLRELGYLE